MEQELDKSAWTSDPVISRLTKTKDNTKIELLELRSMCWARGCATDDELFHQFAKTIDSILKLF